MDFDANIAELQSRLRQHREILETEEAAKTTLVLPFLRALGFDVFNPAEVKPEFTCDVGTRKGEKVDYALCVGGEVTVLVECKSASSDLSIKHASQLFRYFAATNARVSLLTNGVTYKFFTDSDKANMMDEAPFFTFNLDDYRKSDIRNLAAFQKSEFDVDRIVAQAGTLKLQSQVLAELKKEFAEPSEEFVRVIAARLHDGMLTKPVRDKYQAAITQAIGALIRQGIDERLQNAMKRNDEPEPSDEPAPDGNSIETTQVEIDGFNIIRAICAKVVTPDRIVIRDAKSYCAVLLDDNNRRTIARMHFNSPTARYLGVFTGKDEERRPVSGPVDIYQHADALLARINELESGS
ncbi:type I restriction endonuclease [Novosphingobium mangrovi (ex Huang et al. 2023)]|uniref:Type I restriction endonuclease n=1 Tax=Novosphingobium mangrovi (ex Huang et al. 2023) TaxID=2976432 RepID=A0ABT2I260_9SPHN|nr:type I restriction endonuclease [Novosphingobium mangrovi (ex Huang et al. 2023)]MCT2398886.1 type I restriction endonuclease [Novosphingobium mangrovi (ex Huang et al. 2023)]